MNPVFSRGFTLVEVLVSVAILGILAALALPVYWQMRDKAHLTTTLNQMGQIHAAINLYAAEHNNTYPPPSNPAGGTHWAKAIASDHDYLGPSSQWIHHALRAPGIDYENADGSQKAEEDVYLTYCATGIMCQVLPTTWLNFQQGRRLSRVRRPSDAPLVFLAKQRPQKDGYSRTVVASTRHIEVQRDLGVANPEDTVLFNFDLANQMPVLMADGSIQSITFEELPTITVSEKWEDRLP